ncbi:phospholipase D1 [Trichonephila inaurata madagascariensis]|uniref:phospholipase D n=1 Tax=Trichonephila inaurata madagascariensis TaxID=2747483 RepID=A0A8X6IQ50_9ARAC|nr:phospholipase D1 [Trichonephila inaurata madagascariensis]
MMYGGKPEIRFQGLGQISSFVPQKHLNFTELNTDSFTFDGRCSEFLEVGPLSFVEDLGLKSKEGFVSRRFNELDSSFGLCVTLCQMFPIWKKRWMFIKENFVGFMDPRSGRVENILLFDRAFRVDTYKNKVFIQNLSRIVDGATYFEAVAEVLDKATEEIFITDWWLSPEIYLKRPTVHGHYWQLDYILKRKARAGVRIYVLLYKELEVALGINSHHSEKQLRRMHKNIKVIRHPEVSKGVFLWAHHEKIVCVDQSYAFVGGLDLCYGRWDDYQHKLSDFGDVEEKVKAMRHRSIAPRMNFAARKSVSSNSMPGLTLIDEMHDQKKTDLRTTVRKYQAAQTFEGIQRRLSIEAAMDATGDVNAFSYMQPADRRRTMQETTLTVLGMNKKFRLWHGKDYANFISKDIQDLHQPYSDNVDRETTPRMPWHDVGLFVQGKVARDVARHFVLRWNHAKVTRAIDIH